MSIPCPFRAVLLSISYNGRPSCLQDRNATAAVVMHVLLHHKAIDMRQASSNVCRAALDYQLSRQLLPNEPVVHGGGVVTRFCLSPTGPCKEAAADAPAHPMAVQRRPRSVRKRSCVAESAPTPPPVEHAADAGPDGALPAAKRPRCVDQLRHPTFAGRQGKCKLLLTHATVCDGNAPILQTWSQVTVAPSTSSRVRTLAKALTHTLVLL